MSATVDDLDYQALLIAAIAFAPPLLFIFLTLDRYDGLFSMRRLTVFFTIGLAAGSLAAVVEYFLMFEWGLNDSLATAFLGYVVGIVLAEEMLKVVIFNYPKWTGKFHAMFDAAAFGAAFGSGFPLFFLSANAATGDAIDWQTYLTLLGLCVANAMFHIGNTLVICRGSVERDIWWWGLRGVALRFPLNLMVLMWFADLPLYFVLIPALPYAFAVWYKARDVLADAVPKEAVKAAARARAEMESRGK